LKTGPVGCRKTSATFYQSTLPEIPEEVRFGLYRGKSMQPHNFPLPDNKQIVFGLIIGAGYEGFTKQINICVLYGQNK
jgi:hypothetical protein